MISYLLSVVAKIYMIQPTPDQLIAYIYVYIVYVSYNDNS